MSRLDEHLDALRRHTEPSPARLRRIRGEPRAESRRWWLPVVAAAVVLLGLGLWSRRIDEPVRHTFEGAHTTALGRHVRVRAEGSGSAAGDTQDLRIEWMAGRVAVEVEPDQRVELEVVTREAVVRVVGTAFDVSRDALGTHVTVHRGTVAVTCGASSSVRLGRGQSRTCRPVDAVGWLRRATALQVAERPREVLDSVAAGLALQPERAIELELRLHRLAALLALGEGSAAEGELARLRAAFPEARHRLEAFGG
ncbi:MAG: FecR domain-containing protein [Myxococcota bacterium]